MAVILCQVSACQRARHLRDGSRWSQRLAAAVTDRRGLQAETRLAASQQPPGSAAFRFCCANTPTGRKAKTSRWTCGALLCRQARRVAQVRRAAVPAAAAGSGERRWRRRVRRGQKEKRRTLKTFDWQTLRLADGSASAAARLNARPRTSPLKSAVTPFSWQGARWIARGLRGAAPSLCLGREAAAPVQHHHASVGQLQNNCPFF